MDLHAIEEELHRLTDLVGGWRAGGRMSGLERDLALEKLRRIYDALRFAEDAAPASAGLSVEESVHLDLDEMLGVVPSDGGPEPDPTWKAVSQEMPQPEIPSGDAHLPETAAVEADGQEVPPSESAAERVPAADEVPPGEPPVPVAQEPPVVLPDGGAVPEPVPQSDAFEADDSRRAGRRAEPEKATVIEPALFGMDEIVQHKRKQRVIMALYDDRPEPVRESLSAAGESAGEAGGGDRWTRTASEPEHAITDGESREAAPEKSTERSPDIAASPFAAEPLPDVAAEAAPASNPSAAEQPPQEETEKRGEGVVRGPNDPRGAVLGEVMNRDVQTLGETIAQPRDAVSDIAHRAPVSDLREAIGINDRFLLIRDLFGGDAETCERVIDTLNAFTDLDDCMIHIAEHYAWNPNSDGARLLMDLLERKLA